MEKDEILIQKKLIIGWLFLTGRRKKEKLKRFTVYSRWRHRCWRRKQNKQKILYAIKGAKEITTFSHVRNKIYFEEK